MSAIDDFLANQPAAPAANAPQDVSALIQRDATTQAVPPSLRAPRVPASAAGGAGAAAVQPAAGQPVPVTNGFLTGVGDIVKGGAQDIVHGLSWVADKIAPDSQFARDARAALPQMQQTIDQQNQAYDAQRAANGQSGIDLARLGGNAVGTLPVMAMGGGEGLLGRIGMGALQGGVSGGLMPTTGNSDQSFGQQKAAQIGLGAATGAAIPAAFEGARAVGNGLWNVVQPVVQPGRYVGRGIANAMDPAEAAAAAANIRSAPQFVQGSVPTTAQAAQTPFMVQTEKAAGNIPSFKTAMAQRAIDNNDARWNALMGVAQTPEALQAAQTARADAVQPLYDAANQQTANVGRAFMRFAQRPAVQQAMQRADTMAQNEGVNLTWPQQGGSREINGQALDYTKRALDDMIGEAQRSGSAQQVRALTDANDYLKSWTQSYIPAQRQAAQTYAQMSVPVNTMEAGQAIANGLGTRAMNAGGVPEIQMMPFRSALQSAMKNSPFGIEAGAHNTLQGIGQDLQRATVSNSIKSPGSDTAYNLAAQGWLARQLYGPTFGGAGNVGKAVGALGAMALGHPMAGLGILGAGNRIGQMVGGRLQDRLTGLLMDPNTVLPYLDARAAAAAQAVPNPLMQGLLNYGRPAITNGLAGGLVNANQ
jgi:hypothetical protein